MKKTVFNDTRTNRLFWNGYIKQTIGFYRENARLALIHPDSQYVALARSYKASVCKALRQRKVQYYFNQSLDYGTT